MRCYLLLNVDDILITCNDNDFLDVLILELMQSFRIRQLSDNYIFLSLKICRDIDKKVITLDQKSAIENLIKKFNVENCKSFKTPIEKNLNLNHNSNNDLQTKLPYKELLGSLMYIMMSTRPDICFSIAYFGRIQDCATDEHFNHLLRVLKYLKTTIDFKLYFQYCDNYFGGYADSDFANDSIENLLVDTV